MHSPYRFKRSFADEPTLSRRLFDLLEGCFTGVRQAKERANAMGAPWEEASTPFLRFHEELAICHVGVLEIPLVIMGRSVTVGGIHAVCTRRELRRRGYYREVMEEVLEYCAARYETLLLSTTQPELYQPFGFRVVREHVFRTPCVSGRDSACRPLDTQNPGDQRLLLRLLETRSPVSNIAGVVREKAIFCFNEAGSSLRYAQDLDAVVSLEIDGAQLRLFDVVATEIPPLAAVLARIPERVTEVVVYFSPDRLDTRAEAVPHVLDRKSLPVDTLLMVRGPFAAEGQAFMLPRSARC